MLYLCVFAVDVAADVDAVVVFVIAGILVVVVVVGFSENVSI